MSPAAGADGYGQRIERLSRRGDRFRRCRVPPSLGAVVLEPCVTAPIYILPATAVLFDATLAGVGSASVATLQTNVGADGATFLRVTRRPCQFARSIRLRRPGTDYPSPTSYALRCGTGWIGPFEPCRKVRGVLGLYVISHDAAHYVESSRTLTANRNYFWLRFVVGLARRRQVARAGL
jgi:hypothetical protein